MQFGELKYAWEEKPFGHSMLPYLPNETSSLYGSRWQTLSTDCQLDNLILPILQGNVTDSTTSPVRILVFGDSTGRIGVCWCEGDDT